MRPWITSLYLCSLPLMAAAAAMPTTYDGKHSIREINVTAAYFLPKDRKALPDWKDRAEYFLRRIKAFHERESFGQSRLKVTLHPTPLATERTTDYFRRGDQNRTFFDTLEEAKALLKWEPRREAGFSILLVLSDINWRELDDFRRVRLVDGKEVHEGHIGADGRHFPGAESGGARAIYHPDGFGWGLVSADGWRVPYSGSDCVVYHEGLGHTIGLPHPEPSNGSVMGTAQYQYWLNETWVDPAQKVKLGWVAPTPAPDHSRDLFTHFRALQQPIVPKVGEPVTLALRWPKGARVKSFKVRVQTELFGEWETLPTSVTGAPPATVPLRAFTKPTPVSYRVDVLLEDDQTAEMRGYFQVK